MRLTYEVRIAQPANAVFDTLLQVDRAADCVPGGRLTGSTPGDGRDGAARYAGAAAVRVGPLRTAYDGTARYLEVDRDARVIALRASGTERSGQGDADAYILIRVLPDDADAAPHARSVLSVEVDLLVRGRVAQLGQGVVGELGRRLIAEFAGNVEHLLATPPAPPPAPAPAPPPAAGPTAGRARKCPTPAAFAAGVAAAATAGVLLRHWLRRNRTGSAR